MSPPSPLHRPPPDAAVLFIIRAALVLGVLTFAAVTWYIHSSAPRPAYPAEPTLSWAVLGAWALVTAALLFIGGRYRHTEARVERVRLAIVGWALGEMAALLGGVHYFLTGDPLRFGFGLLIFCIALVMFPIPRNQGASRS
ncbi:MAG TPA: hypothetical protein VEW03_12025 [Longimicrobiaceae bacterium]|nr:hypothetical protein [Longimicrobiaceae bacterium]